MFLAQSHPQPGPDFWTVLGSLGSFLAAMAALTAILLIGRERRRTMRSQMLLDVVDLLSEGDEGTGAEKLRRWQRIHARIRILRFDKNSYLWRRFQPYADKLATAEALGITYIGDDKSIERWPIEATGRRLGDVMFDELRTQIQKDIGIKIERPGKSKLSEL